MRSSCSFHNQKLSAETCLPTLSVNFRVGHDAELSLPTFTRVSSLRFTSLLLPQEITSFLAYPHLLQGLQCVHFHVPNRIWEKEISQPPEDFCPFWTVSGVYCPLWDVKVIHQTLNYKVFTVFFCWKLWDKTEFVSLASKTLWSSRDQIQDDYKEIKKKYWQCSYSHLCACSSSFCPLLCVTKVLVYVMPSRKPSRIFHIWVTRPPYAPRAVCLKVLIIVCSLFVTLRPLGSWDFLKMKLRT